MEKSTNWERIIQYESVILFMKIHKIFYKLLWVHI